MNFTIKTTVHPLDPVSVTIVCSLKSYNNGYEWPNTSQIISF
jgi:hypothetical protein